MAGDILYTYSYLNHIQIIYLCPGTHHTFTLGVQKGVGDIWANANSDLSLVSIYFPKSRYPRYPENQFFTSGKYEMKPSQSHEISNKLCKMFFTAPFVWSDYKIIALFPRQKIKTTWWANSPYPLQMVCSLTSNHTHTHCFSLPLSLPEVWWCRLPGCQAVFIPTLGCSSGTCCLENLASCTSSGMTSFTS